MTLSAAPSITIFTEAGPDLAPVYQGLRRQTWKNWTWIICGAQPSSPPGANDPRVISDTGQWKTMEDGYICWLPASFVLKPVALERWIWFLDRHPQYLLADGRTLHTSEKEPILSGRFPAAAGEEGSLYETPFLSRGRLTSFFSGPQEISNELIWTRVVKVEKGFLGWTVWEIASTYPSTLSKKELSPEAAAKVAGYWEEEKLLLPTRATFQTIDLNLGWEIPEPPSVSPRRMLMILPSLFVNGANTFNLYVARILVQAGYTVHVITLTGDEHERTSEFEKLTDHIFHLFQFLDPHDYAGFIWSFIQSRGIGSIFTSETHLGKYMVPLLRSQAPWLSAFDYCHVLHEDERPGSHPRQTVALLSQFDLAAVSSEALRHWLLQAGASEEPERIEVCYTGVDAGFWSSTACIATHLRAAIPADRPILLYACRLDTQKNPMLFAEVVAELMREDKIDFEVLIVGNGPFGLPLEEFFKKNEINHRVRFTGFATLPLMREIYRLSDIFFLPSLWEGISLGLYEAMSMGLASVVTDVGGQRELLTPECGRLLSVGPNLKADCRKALRDLLTDASLRHRMGKAARHRIAEGFDLIYAGRRVIELFKRAETLHQEAPRKIWPQEIAMEMIRQEIAAEDSEKKKNILAGDVRLLAEQVQIQQKKLDKLATKVQIPRPRT